MSRVFSFLPFFFFLPLLFSSASPRVDAGDQGGQGDIFDTYEFKEELGRGAFSIVKLAINKVTGAKVAVKVIDKTKMSEQYKKNLQMETDILRKVRHPNIIQMNEIFETDEYLFLVMEMVTGGELFDKIIEKGCYTEKEAAVLVRKIVSAIDYLHGLEICHRDLVSLFGCGILSFCSSFFFLKFCFFS
jgi:serine/threonine protein kinase